MTSIPVLFINSVGCQPHWIYFCWTIIYPVAHSAWDILEILSASGMSRSSGSSANAFAGLSRLSLSILILMTLSSGADSVLSDQDLQDWPNLHSKKNQTIAQKELSLNMDRTWIGTVDNLVDHWQMLLNLQHPTTRSCFYLQISVPVTIYPNAESELRPSWCHLCNVNRDQLCCHSFELHLIMFHKPLRPSQQDLGPYNFIVCEINELIVYFTSILNIKWF